MTKKSADSKQAQALNGSNSSTMISRYVERFENLDGQKSELQEDYKQLKAQITADGLEPAIIQMLVKLRASEKAREKFALVQNYADAIQLDLFGSSEAKAA